MSENSTTTEMAEAVLNLHTALIGTPEGDALNDNLIGKAAAAISRAHRRNTPRNLQQVIATVGRLTPAEAGEAVRRYAACFAA